MKNIIILGGSFDPIHLGHIEILNEALKQKKYDEGWLLPAKYARWKSHCLSINKRLKLLEIVVKNEKNFYLCKEEVNSTTVNYTYDTIKRLLKKYKDYKFSFLIGYDQLRLLDKWYKIDKLAKLITFVVVKRPNYELNSKNLTKYNCEVLDYCGPDISSTEFKNNLNLNLLPSYLHKEIINTPDYYKFKLKSMISYKRYLHSLQVAKLSKEIAELNGYDGNKAFLAGLLHDCAKDVEKPIEHGIMQNMFLKHINESHYIYHQFVGSILVKNEFNINDEEIIEAIKWHTTGKKNMSTLAKIIYAADKIEPSRGYDSNYMIEACLKDIEEGFRLVLSENYKFLLNKGFKIANSCLTKECLEYYKII